jgi:23S rRNA (adenine2503-C2)-methyltransferase
VDDRAGLRVELPAVARCIESDSAEGLVRKFTLPVPRRPGGADIGGTIETESVVIPMIGKRGVRSHTLCVSSQVGCAMGCGFCQTAQMGLLRSLTAREIVQQWLVARHTLGVQTIQNIVFMGMGEPMDNLDAVIAAIDVLRDHRGPGLAISRITVSTVGRIDGIRRLAEQVRRPGWHRLGFAVSLNAPTDEVRSSIMPINRAAPLAALREALEGWPVYAGTKICFEYVLIPAVNDAPEHAQQLADFICGRGVWAGRPRLAGLVNLIPYNPREDSPWPAPDEAAVEAFLGWVCAAGVLAKRRRTKGRDTMAACGQLGNLAYRREPRNGGRGGLVAITTAPMA